MAQYFQRTYNRRVDPNLPCVRLGRDQFVPMDCLEVRSAPYFLCMYLIMKLLRRLRWSRATSFRPRSSLATKQLTRSESLLNALMNAAPWCRASEARRLTKETPAPALGASKSHPRCSSLKVEF